MADDVVNLEPEIEDGLAVPEATKPEISPDPSLVKRGTDHRPYKFDTIAVHGAYDHAAMAANQGSIIEPLYLSTAQHFANSERLAAALSYQEPAWGYSRISNPTVAGGADVARQVLDRVQLICRATDLGRIKSVATIPTISTHQQQGSAGRKLATIPDNLIRLSIGGEHVDDVIVDLDHALGR